MIATPEKSIELIEVTLDLIDPTSDNPRIFRDDDPALAELADSIRAAGVLEPILLRPHPTAPGRYELRAGERRWRAARLAGLDTIPAILRPMTDEEALEVTITENLQREDLSPLEEAKGIAILIERRNWTHDEIAAQLGKSRQWVARRAALSDLSHAWRAEALDAKSPVSSWPVANLELVAPFTREIQDTLLADLKRHWSWKEHADRWSSRDLRDKIAHYMHGLKSAPWKLDDAALCPAAGPCSLCHKRSDRQRDLFDDEDPIEPDNAKPNRVPKSARCLDPVCWSAKLAAHLQIRETKLRADHGDDLLLLTTESRDAAIPEPFRNKKVANHYDFSTVTKTTPGAKPALVVSGPTAGQVQWVKSYSSSHGRAAEKPAGPKSLKERRAALEKTRGKIVCAAVIEKLEALSADTYDDEGNRIPPAAVTPPIPTHTILALAATFGTHRNESSLGQYSHQHKDGVQWTRFDESLAAPEESIADRVLVGVIPVLLDRIRTGVLYLDVPPLKEVARVCTLFGWDLDELTRQAREEKPEPRSWATLNADGTPKAKTKTSKSAKAKEKTPPAKNTSPATAAPAAAPTPAIAPPSSNRGRRRPQGSQAEPKETQSAKPRRPRPRS